MSVLLAMATAAKAAIILILGCMAAGTGGALVLFAVAILDHLGLVEIDRRPAAIVDRCLLYGCLFGAALMGICTIALGTVLD